MSLFDWLRRLRSPPPEPSRISTPAPRELPPEQLDAIRRMLAELPHVRLPKSSHGSTLAEHLDAFGISREDAKRIAESAFPDPSVEPTLPRFLVAVSDALHEREDRHFASWGSTLYQAALALNGAGRGDYFPVLRESARVQLREYQREGVAKVEILRTGDTCRACRSSRRRVWTVREALATMPIPVEGCTNVVRGCRSGFCRCTWTPRL